MLWTRDFGDEYTIRNAKADDSRLTIWKIMLPRHVTSVLEVGANIGLNLEAIEQSTNCELFACEPNDSARTQLIESNIMPASHITADFADNLSFPDGIADLAFTCGVLIHIPADKLVASMREIHRCASQWIICGEYFAPSEEMVPYRGHNDALWRRDYGSIWLDNFKDLRCHGCLFAWKPLTGLDNITFWIFEKGEKVH